MAPPELVTCFSDTTSGAFAFCGLRGLVRVAMVSRHREGGSDSSRGDGAASVSGMLLVLPDCFASDERLVAALRAVNAVAAAASAATTNGAPASGDPAWTEDEQHRMVDVIERPESVKPMALLNDKAVTTILTILVLRIVLGGQRPLSAALTRFVRVLEVYEGVRNRMLDGLFGDRSVTWGDWRRAATMASVRIMPSFNSKGVLLTNYVAFNVAIERERLARQRHIAGSFLQAPGESAVDFERRLAASIFAVVDFIQLSPETARKNLQVVAENAKKIPAQWFVDDLLRAVHRISSESTDDATMRSQCLAILSSFCQRASRDQLARHRDLVMLFAAMGPDAADPLELFTMLCFAMAKLDRAALIEAAVLKLLADPAVANIIASEFPRVAGASALALQSAMSPGEFMSALTTLWPDHLPAAAAIDLLGAVQLAAQQKTSAWLTPVIATLFNSPEPSIPTAVAAAMAMAATGLLTALAQVRSKSIDTWRALRPLRPTLAALASKLEHFVLRTATAGPYDIYSCEHIAIVAASMKGNWSLFKAHKQDCSRETQVSAAMPVLLAMVSSPFLLSRDFLLSASATRSSAQDRLNNNWIFPLLAPMAQCVVLAMEHVSLQEAANMVQIVEYHAHGLEEDWARHRAAVPAEDKDFTKRFWLPAFLSLTAIVDAVIHKLVLAAPWRLKRADNDLIDGLLQDTLMTMSSLSFIFAHFEMDNFSSFQTLLDDTVAFVQATGRIDITTVAERLLTRATSATRLHFALDVCERVITALSPAFVSDRLIPALLPQLHQSPDENCDHDHLHDHSSHSHSHTPNLHTISYAVMLSVFTNRLPVAVDIAPFFVTTLLANFPRRFDFQFFKAAFLATIEGLYGEHDAAVVWALRQALSKAAMWNPKLLPVVIADSGTQTEASSSSDVVLPPSPHDIGEQAAVPAIPREDATSDLQYESDGIANPLRKLNESIVLPEQVTKMVVAGQILSSIVLSVRLVSLPVLGWLLPIIEELLINSERLDVPVQALSSDLFKAIANNSDYTTREHLIQWHFKITSAALPQLKRRPVSSHL